jgi:p-hydroxybenzoate 3-monooxygenase
MGAVLRTQIGIVGGGPAGLILARLLNQAGIESVVLESQPRAYAERRVRASVLEPATVAFLNHSGLGERLHSEGTEHESIQLRFEGQGHRLALSELAQGHRFAVYEQQNIVQDLLQTGTHVEFEARVTGVERLDSTEPVVHYRQAGEVRDLTCDMVAGCDGFWGVCRSAIPEHARKMYRRDYPFNWLGVLAAVPATGAELVYAYHPRGFGLWGLGAAGMSRFYLQSRPDETIDDWPDERIWREAEARLEGLALRTGDIVEKAVTTLHSVVVEPMQYGRLFLVGDAAHLTPPTAAKGMNLALADVRVLAPALIAWFQSGETQLLEAYSSSCLRRVWWAEHVSWWMTWLLHDWDDAFQQRLQLAQLRQLVDSRAAAAAFAENYLGIGATESP